METPGWMRENARRGIRWYEEGYAGDGLRPETVSEAREMAAGEVTEEKAVRMAAWFARHMGDITGVSSDQDPPTPGMVAHALWGGWPREESLKAQRWAEQNTAEKSAKAPGDRIIVSDMDDTLCTPSGDPIENTVAHLRERNAEGIAVIIVSGRQDSRLEETRAWLTEHDVPHSQVFLNDFPEGPNAARAFKTYKAEKLLEDGYIITEWIENDQQTREELEAMEINTTDPRDLESVPGDDDTDTTQAQEEQKSMDFKTYKAELQPADDTGTVEALVSVFGNIDYAGDRVVPGAFTKTLEEYAMNGRTIPFVWSHDYDTPESYIGKVVEATETSEGLRVKAQLFETPRAQVVRELLVNRVVNEFSFAYEIVNQQKSQDGANELTELRILECGPTMRGANPMTRLIDAKNAAAAAPEDKAAPELQNEKAGRTLSSKNEVHLRSAQEKLAEASAALEEVLSSINVREDAEDTAKTEEPETKAKVQEPVRDPNIALALIQLSQLD
jgi:HK97 family phage prohead protease